MNKRELLFILRFKNAASPQMRRVTRDLKKLGAAAAAAARVGLRAVAAAMQKAAVSAGMLGKSMVRASGAMRAAGATMTMAVSGPLAALTYGAIRAAGSFEQSMNTVQAVTTATASEFKRLRNEAKELGATTAFTASQVAEGMVFLGKTGLDTTQILDSIGPSLNLAAAGNIELAQSANVVTNILKGYGKDISELPFAVDALAKAYTSANVDIFQLSETFKYAAPILRAADQDFTASIAVIGKLGDAGIHASMAGTAIRAIMRDLQKDFMKSSSVLRQLNVELYNSDGTIRNLSTVMEELRDAGIDNEQMLTLFKDRARVGAEALQTQLGPAMTELVEKLLASGGTAERLQKVQLKGLFGAFRKLRSAVEALFIAVGDTGLLANFTKLVNKVTTVVRQMNAADKQTLKTYAKYVLLGTAIGPLIVVLGLLTFAFGQIIIVVAAVGKIIIWLALTVLPMLAKALLFIATRALPLFLTPWGLVVAAIGAAAAAIMYFTDQEVTLMSVTREVVNGVIRLFQTLGESIGLVFSVVWTIMTNWWDKFKQGWVDIGRIIKRVLVGDFMGALEIMREPEQGLLDGVKDQFVQFGDDMKELWGPTNNPTGELVKAGRAKFDEYVQMGKDKLANLFKIEWPKIAGEGAEKVKEAMDQAKPKRTAPGADDEGFRFEWGEDFYKGLNEGFDEWLAKAKDVTGQAKEAFQNFADGATDAMLDFLETGKFNWREFVTSLSRDLNRMALNTVFAKAAEGMKGLLSKLRGGEPGGQDADAVNAPVVSAVSQLTQTTVQGQNQQAQQLTQLTQATSQGLQAVVQAVSRTGAMGGGGAAAPAGGAAPATQAGGGGAAGAVAGGVGFVQNLFSLVSMFEKGGMSHQARKKILGPTAMFAGAPGFQRGGDTIPALLSPGERVLNPRETRDYMSNRGGDDRPNVVNVSIATNDVEGFRRSSSEVTAEIAGAVRRGAHRNS